MWGTRDPKPTTRCRSCEFPGFSGRVRRMFAHSTQNWWWTAHPAAH
ncbi:MULTISPECIES: trp operon leader peptide [unclassified Streptomyces]